MQPENLSNAARALEDAFFARENARLLEELRAKEKLQERRQALRGVVMVHDEALIDHLIQLGIGPETVLALALVPLAMVAWADGAIQPKEREAILAAAEERGVEAGTLARQMLEKWLERQPDASLVDAWKRMTRAVWPSLSPHERDEIRQVGLERARQVAEAAGGLLSLTARISAKERAVLDELAALLAD